MLLTLRNSLCAALAGGDKRKPDLPTVDIHMMPPQSLPGTAGMGRGSRSGNPGRQPIVGNPYQRVGSAITSDRLRPCVAEGIVHSIHLLVQHVFRKNGEFQPQGSHMPPRRYAHFLFAAIQSALTSSIAAAIASFNLIWVGGFLEHWLRSWAVAWIIMLPVVIVAAPAIVRLSEAMTRPDATNVGD